MILDFVRLDPMAMAPVNAYGDDAGWDLHVLEDTFCREGEHTDVRTGVAVAISTGYFGRIVGRSSAFRKKGLIVLEGTIDCGFRGELFSSVYFPPPGSRLPVDTVVRYVHPSRFKRERGVLLRAGESVAQLIVCPVPNVEWREVAELPPSLRGENGFGSSGR